MSSGEELGLQQEPQLLRTPCGGCVDTSLDVYGCRDVAKRRDPGEDVEA
jgi:hypothetical protein